MANVSVHQYLQEDGNGQYRSFRVRDLAPASGEPVDLLLVVESPHRDELRTGLPLAGDAGQRALAYLAPRGAPPEALGPWVATMHSAGDFRVGIMNVSPVPLQEKAFSGHRSPPRIAAADWELLERVRTHRASTIASLPTTSAIAVNKVLVAGIQSRLASLKLTPNSTIALAGNFVHRTWDSVAMPSKGSTLQIPHPANGWWTRTADRVYRANLATLMHEFARLTK